MSCGDPRSKRLSYSSSVNLSMCQPAADVPTYPPNCRNGNLESRKKDHEPRVFKRRMGNFPSARPGNFPGNTNPSPPQRRPSAIGIDLTHCLFDLTQIFAPTLWPWVTSQIVLPVNIPILTQIGSTMGGAPTPKWYHWF